MGMSGEKPSEHGSARSDAQLVAEARSGRPAAFAQLVERYQVLACSIVYSLTGNLAQGEEIVQEAFLIAWRRLHNMEDPERFRPWLCGITRHLALRSLRRSSNEVRLAPFAGALEGQERSEPSPLERIIADEEEHLLRRALESIPETNRLPLILFYGHEM